jgi:hypothetical protein
MKDILKNLKRRNEMIAENDQLSTLQVVVLVVVVIIVAPIVINGILTIGALIVNAFKPKLYDATLTYTDGTTSTRRGTKKEMERWISEQREAE